MGDFALSLVRKHFPEQNVPFGGLSPYCVVLENSDHESESHAREQIRAVAGGRVGPRLRYSTP